MLLMTNLLLTFVNMAGCVHVVRMGTLWMLNMQLFGTYNTPINDTNNSLKATTLVCDLLY